KPQMIAEQLFEVLRILNSFEIKSDRISAECGIKIPVDLNKGAKGAYLWLAFKRSSNQDPITGLTVIEGQNASPPSGYTKINVDLNKGAGGKYLYLCYTRNKTAKPISDVIIRLATANHDKLDPVYGYDGVKYEIIPRDLNWEAGGSYIFLYYIRLQDNSGYFNNGIKPDMIGDIGKEYESARVQFDVFKVLVRTQKLKLEQRTLLPSKEEAKSPYNHTVTETIGVTNSVAEQFSREIGISMGGGFPYFSASIDAKLGYSLTKTFTTSEETSTAKELPVILREYPIQFMYCRIVDVLRVVDIPSGSVISIMESRTPDDGYFIQNAEQAFVEFSSI
ncbi:MULTISPECIES: hypothetical protein, partial [unclassified Microcoleus]|uniref:hypothetical protein n=1 Tax=unclassified Microcoleus TaxID=2642155 RepID=UPI0025CFDDAA